MYKMIVIFALCRCITYAIAHHCMLLAACSLSLLACFLRALLRGRKRERELTNIEYLEQEVPHC